MEILEVYDEYVDLGINARPITTGQEFDMVKDFIDFKKNKFKPSSKKNMAIFIETKINEAYPDVVFAEYDPYCYEQWNNQRDKLTKSDLKLLHFIFSKRNVSSQRIVKELSIQYKSLLQSLEKLMDAELIIHDKGYWEIQNRRSAFGIKRIEAVEAKISKWEEVMQQAIINRAFASESFVLSKRKRKMDENVIERIGEFGIGIYLYADDQFSCYSQAMSNRMPANYNSIYLNECIGRILNH